MRRPRTSNLLFSRRASIRLAESSAFVRRMNIYYGRVKRKLRFVFIVLALLTGPLA